jgi:hypothetical protein
LQSDFTVARVRSWHEAPIQGIRSLAARSGKAENQAAIAGLRDL